MTNIMRRVVLFLGGMLVFVLGFVVNAQSLNIPTDLISSNPTVVSTSLSWTDTSGSETAFLLERTEGTSEWFELARLAANSNSYLDTQILCNQEYQYRLRAYDETTESYSDYSAVVTGLHSACPQINVTSSDDTNDGTCDASHCSLREAILLVNGNASSTPTEVLLPAGTISLSTELPHVNYPALFVGQSTQSTIIDGNNQDYIFRFNSGNYGSIQKLTLRNAQTLLNVPGSSFQWFLADSVIFEDASERGFYFAGSDNQGFVVRDSVFHLSTGTNELNGALNTFLLERNSFVNNPVDERRLIAVPGSNHQVTFINNTFSNNSFTLLSPGVVYISGSNIDFYFSHNTFADNDAIPIKIPGGGNVLRYIGNIFSNNAVCAIDAPHGISLSLGYNLFQGDSCVIEGGNDSDVTGENLIDVLTEFEVAGVPHYVHPLVTNSPAVDAALDCNLRFDQLINGRPAASACDSGAFEVVRFDAPDGLSATYEEASQIDLLWIDNASIESAYLLERSSNGGTSWTEIAELPANSESYSDTDLACDTSYQYRVRAYQAEDNTHTDYSNTANVSINCTVFAPTNLLASNPVNTPIVNLTWNDNASNETGFILESSTNAGLSWQVIQTLSADSTNYSIANQGCGVNHGYRLRAYRMPENLYSLYSNIANIIVPCFVAAPGNLTINSFSTELINLSWTDNSWNETSFRIERSLDNLSWTELTSVDSNVTSTTVDSLCGGQYYFRLRAYNHLLPLYSDYSNVVNVLTQLCQPSDFTANPGATNVALTWLGNNNYETGFKLQRRVAGGEWQALVTLPADSASYNDTALDCQSSYSYRLKAYGSLAEDSSWVTVTTTTSNCPPLVPSVLSSTGNTSSSISLDWTVDETATTFTLWVNNGAGWTNLDNFNETNHIYTGSPSR